MPSDVSQRAASGRAAHQLRVRTISHEEMNRRASEVASIVGSCGADPLFSNVAWLSTWWEVFGSIDDASWACLGAFDSQDRLIALLPLFERTGRLRAVFSIPRLEWLGGFWYGPPSALTQYQELLTVPDSSSAVVDAFMSALANRPGWSELVVNHVRRGSPSLPLLVEAAETRGWWVRSHDLGPSMVVDLSDGFEAYRAGLGAKTRRRVFHLRRRLADLGSVDFGEVPREDTERYFELMNRLRKQSRGTAGFSDEAIRFHMRLVSGSAGGIRPRLTALRIDGKPVSVNYALQAGERFYGILVGYDASVARGLSLGMIHVGMAIEAAAEEGAKSYDLMGGEDPESGWKGHMANQTIPMGTLQIVRSRTLAAMYRLHDRARGTNARAVSADR